MDYRGAQQYKEQAIYTMTPDELLQLVFSEICKKLTQAEITLKQENYEAFEKSVDKATVLINHLDATLDFQYDISKSLDKLYEYFNYQLCRAKIGRRSDLLEEIRGRVKELQDAFAQAQKNIDSGKQDG